MLGLVLGASSILESAQAGGDTSVSRLLTVRVDTLTAPFAYREAIGRQISLRADTSSGPLPIQEAFSRPLALRTDTLTAPFAYREAIGRQVSVLTDTTPAPSGKEAFSRLVAIRTDTLTAPFAYTEAHSRPFLVYRTSLGVPLAASCSKDSLIFYWTPTSDFNYYRLFVATGPNAAAIFDSVSVGPDTTALYPASLTEGVRYYARGAGSKDGGVTFADVSAFNAGTLIDRTAPNATIVSGPSDGSFIGATDTTFVLSGTDSLTAVAELEYSHRLDGGAWSAYSTVTSAPLAGLTAGPHQFEARVRDCAGNEDVTPASRSFTVDLIAPETQLLAGPAQGDTLLVAQADFRWSGSDDRMAPGQLAYSYRLDGGAWSACDTVTSATLTVLADGAHVFEARARDLAGNLDATPASRSFWSDAQPPAIAMVSGPAPGACLDSSAVAFRWTASDVVTPTDRIEYRHRQDGGAWSGFGHDTTASFAGVAEGGHELLVEARDLMGHVGTITRGFVIDRVAPLVEAPTQRALENAVVRVQCAGSDATGIVSFRVEVATDTLFATALLDTLLDAAGTGTFTGVPGRIYYARAQAADCAGKWSAWSPASDGVTIAYLPDLVVRAAQAPASAASGQPIQVSWTVADSALGATNVAEWYDDVYLSPGAVFDPLTATRLGRFVNPFVLAPADSYTSTFQVVLPRGASGAYRLVFVTDATNQVREAGESNNVRVSAPLLVTLSAHADLVVPSIAPSPWAYSGDSLTIVWTVKNAGRARTDTDRWWDTVFLSADSLFDTTLPDPNSIRVLDRPLLTSQHIGGLEPESSYVATAHLTLPEGIQGRYFLFVASDLRAASAGETVSLAGEIFENTSELNLSPAGATEVTLTPPANLVLDSVATTSAVLSGEVVTVGWRVTNRGSRETRAVDWLDRVYASADTVLEASDVLLGAFRHVGGLALDASYSVHGSVTLPDSLSGAYHVFVRTDADGVVVQSDRTDDMMRAPEWLVVTLAPWPDLQVTDGAVVAAARAGETVPVSWSVLNAGEGTAAGRSWWDRVFVSPSPTWSGSGRAVAAAGNPRGLEPGAQYLTRASVVLPRDLSGTLYVYVVTNADQQVFESADEQNNAALIGSIAVSPSLPADLAVTAVVAPDTSASGSEVTVTWSVQNTGTGVTSPTSWGEQVYLSADSLLDAGDQRLASVLHGGALAPGAGYQGQATGRIPGGMAGTFRVIVRADFADSTPGDNVRVSATPLAVRLAPPPDLVVTSVSAAAEAGAGQPLMVRWTTANRGSGVTNPAHWTTACYLSTDAMPDGTDLLLGAVTRETGLAPGEQVGDSVVVNLPGWASGPLFLIVTADTRNEVYEGAAENNNVTRAALQVTLAAPADLVVRDVTVPLSALPGDSVTVSWTLANLSTNSAMGRVYDVVYISADTSFDTADPALGVQALDVDIPPGGTQRFAQRFALAELFSADAQGNLTAPLPGLLPGSYHGLVRTNVRKTLREAATENNVGFSESPMQVELPELAIGATVSMTMTAGQSRYYRVPAPPGQDLTLRVESDVPDATNALYASFGAVPAQGACDFAGPAAFTSHPSILIPETRAGSYLVLLVARSLPAGVAEEHLTIAATALPYSLDSVSPARGGRTGFVTTTVAGAGLRPWTTFSLKSGESVVASAMPVQYVNSTQLVARWDLSSVPPGVYDLSAQTGDSVATLPGSFTVEIATALEVTTTAIKPDVIRRNGVATFTFRFHNDANRDLPVLKARLLIPAETQVLEFATDPGLLRRSALYPELFGLAGGDLYVVADPATNYPLQVLDLIAVNVPPDEELTCTVHMRGFERTPFSVRALTEALETQTYIRGELNEIETARLAILAHPAGVPPVVLALATDRMAFADTALQRGHVARGLLTVEDLLRYQALTGGMKGGPTDEPAAPPGLLEELAEGGSCAPPSQVPECQPDLTPIECALPACLTCIRDTVAVPFALPAPVTVDLPRATCQGYASSLCAAARVISPCDPNILIGPEGYGAQRWVAAGTPLPYHVEFENLSGVGQTAAQEVVVKVPIDVGLDPATLRLGTFGFGRHVFAGGQTKSTYTVQTYCPDLGVEVLVVAGLAESERVVQWRFSSRDPATNQAPTNSQIGFLPVNDPSGRGTGFADFTIRAPAACTSGTVVQAQAQITFDLNAMVPTNVEVNRVDSRPPVSHVLPLVEILDTTRVRVRWSGADVDSGSGLESVALYSRSGPNMPFTLQAGNLTGDSLTLVLPWGHGWEFYTRATDAAGNVEASKGTAEAVVVLFGWLGVDTLQSAPLRFAFHPVAPNPFHGQTQLRFELAVGTEASLEVFDVLGRRVAVPLKPKWLAAGPHSLAFRPDRLPDGIYFARLRAGSFERTVKMVLMK